MRSKIKKKAHVTEGRKILNLLYWHITGETPSRANFVEQLTDSSIPRNTDVKFFSFAVEESICTPVGVKMVARETGCFTNGQETTCGCGTKTITTHCVYDGGAVDGQEVPKDASDFECCPTEKTIIVWSSTNYTFY